MTTLFIGTSESLPETSYTKMIDIWMIFCLITTFVEVVIHTWIEYLRDDDSREINDHGRTLQVEARSPVSMQSLIITVHCNISIQIQVIPFRLESGKGLKGLFPESDEDGQENRRGNLKKSLHFVGHVVIPLLIILFAACYTIFGIIRVYSRDN